MRYPPAVPVALESPITALVFVSKHLLALLLLASTAWMAGRLALRRWLDGKGLEGFAVATALGLTLLAHLGLLLGLFGLLTPGPLIAAVAGIHLLGIREWRQWRGSRFPIPGGLLAALAPLFVLALYPPTGFDETLYHLPFARAFARSGGVPFLPELRFPVFPQLSEILFAGLLLLAGDVAAHLVELLAAGTTAALLISWGTRVAAPRAGWLAAAVCLGNPIVVHLATSGYIEAGLTLFVTAALYAADRWRDSERVEWLVLAAVFAASAAGTKYLGLYFVGALFLWLVLAKRRLREPLLYAAVAAAVMAPSYLRILVHTGNPLFPFAARIFGDNPWHLHPLVEGTMADRLAAVIAMPWNMIFDRAEVNYQPPYSPLVLLGLPLLILAAARDRGARWLVAIAVAYASFYVILPPDSRYLTVVLPALSLAMALGAEPWLRRWRPAAAVLLAVLAFLPGWLYAGYRIARQGPLPVTAAERERYLERALPLYPAVRHLNRLRGREYTAYGVHAERMVYLAEGTWLGDWNGPASYARVLPALTDPERLRSVLGELGAGYLAVPRGVGVEIPDTPEWRSRFRRVYADRRVEVFERIP